MELAGKRLGNFSLRARRVFVGLALAPCLVTVANYYLGWGLFGRSEKWSIAVSFVVLFLVMRYLGPTVQQLREYRASGGQVGR
jgi:predicted small integral membrane protein